ncbi:hypothetical protein ACO0K9_11230 [Undibacterium sp. Ji50W]
MTKALQRDLPYIPAEELHCFVFSSANKRLLACNQKNMALDFLLRNPCVMGAHAICFFCLHIKKTSAEHVGVHWHIFIVVQVDQCFPIFLPAILPWVPC